MVRQGRIIGPALLWYVALLPLSSTAQADRFAKTIPSIDKRPAPALHPEARPPAGAWSAEPRKPRARPPKNRITRWRSHPRYLQGWYGIGGSGYRREPEPQIAPRAVQPQKSSRGFGPVIRRDLCAPKVYLIDPDTGAIETYCGHDRRQP